MFSLSGRNFSTCRTDNLWTTWTGDKTGHFEYLPSWYEQRKTFRNRLVERRRLSAYCVQLSVFYLRTKAPTEFHHATRCEKNNLYEIGRSRIPVTVPSVISWKNLRHLWRAFLKIQFKLPTYCWNSWERLWSNWFGYRYSTSFHEF